MTSLTTAAQINLFHEVRPHPSLSYMDPALESKRFHLLVAI